MVSVPRPSKTLLFVLFVGAALAAISLGIAAGDAADGRTYEATAFDPETEAHVLADRSSDVDDLTAAVDSNRSRRALERATGGEAVTVGNESELSYLDSETHAVYRGGYYRVNATENESAGTVTIRLRELTADEAMDDLAVPYESASPAVRRVVDQGNGTIAPEGNATLGGPDVPPVVERDGTYYALGYANPLEVFAPFLSTFVATILGRVGNVYAAAALGVLGATALAERRRALDLRTAAGVAIVAALAHGVLTAVVRTPREISAGTLATNVPPMAAAAAYTAVSAFALAAVLCVGVALRPSGSIRRPLAAVGLVAVGVLGHGALGAATAGSVLPLITTAVTDAAFVAVAGLPLLGLGYVHAAAERDRERPASGQSTTESLDEALR